MLVFKRRAWKKKIPEILKFHAMLMVLLYLFTDLFSGNGDDVGGVVDKCRLTFIAKASRRRKNPKLFKLKTYYQVKKEYDEGKAITSKKFK